MHSWREYRQRNLPFITPTFVTGQSGWLSRYSDSLRVGRSVVRKPEGTRFLQTRSDWPFGPTQPPVQDVPRLLPGVKRPGLSVIYRPPPPCSADIKESVELHLYSPSPSPGLHGQFWGEIRISF